MKTKIKLRLSAFLIGLMLIFCNMGIVVYADTDESTAKAPTVTASDVETTVGSGVYVYIYGNDFTDIAGLELLIGYDPDVFSLGGCYSSGLLQNTSSEFNTETDGQITLNMISADGVTGSGTLLYFILYVKDDAKIGSYTVDIAVGECYGKDLTAVAIASTSCKVNVKKASVAQKAVSFWSSVSTGNALKQGDDFTITYATSNSYSFASCNFEISYDRSLLQVNYAKFGNELINLNGAVYDVNTNIAGYIKATFIALSGVSDYLSDVMTVSFKVLQDTTENTTVDFSASEIYDSELIAYGGNSIRTSVQIEKTVPTVTNPKIYIKDLITSSRTFDLEIIAEGNSAVAVGDFLVSYDASIYTCTSVTKILDGAMLIGNPSYKDGVAKFSFICENGITEDTVLAKLTFTVIGNVCTQNGTMTVEGRNVADKAYNKLTLDYVGGQVTYSGHTESAWIVKNAPTDGKVGYGIKECTVCGTQLESKTFEAVNGERYKVWHNCSFGNDLSMLYAIAKSALADYTDICLIVTKEGSTVAKELTPTEETINGETYYCFRYTGISAKEMGDILTAKLQFIGDGVAYSGTVDTYSLKAYAMERLENSADSDFKTVLVDLLNYGASAQTYFGYKSNALVNADLTDEQKSLATIPALPISKDTDSSGDTDYTTSIIAKNIQFGNRITLLVATSFTQDSDLTGVSLQIRYTDIDGNSVEKFVDGSEFVYRTDVKGYTAYFDGLKASELRTSLELTLIKDGTEISKTVTYGFDAYVLHRLAGSDSENFKELLKKTLSYSDSAKNYFSKAV